MENAVCEKKRKVNARIIIAVAILSIAVLITAMILLVAVKSKDGYKTFIELCEEKEYDEAIAVWESGAVDIAVKSDAQEYVASLAKTAYEDFKNDKMTYHNAKKAAEFVSKIYPGKDFRAELDKMNESKENYRRGLSLEFDGNYMDAISEYKSVSPEDPKYMDAKKKIEDCLEAYRDYLVSQMKKYRISADFEKALKELDEYEENGGKEKELLDYRKIFDYMKEDSLGSGSENYYSATTALTFEAVTGDVCFTADTSHDSETTYSYHSSMSNFTKYIYSMGERGWILSDPEETDTLLAYELVKGDEVLMATYDSDSEEVKVKTLGYIN